MMPFRMDGVLTRPDLVARLTAPVAERLVVTPLTDPERQIGSNTIDLKLGTELLVPRHGRTAYLDLHQRTEAIAASLEAAHERIPLQIGDEFILHEHQFVMATTLEYVGMPQNLAGYVMGRSSWERAGLHVRPARVAPGYRGCIQLQLVSHKDLPITLVTGARICQLMLFPVSNPVTSETPNPVRARPYFSPILDDEELVQLQQSRRGFILGIVGTLASGRSLLAEHLARVHGFVHLSLSTQLYAEARQRGRRPTLAAMQELGNALRHANGSSVLADRLRGDIQELQRVSNLVITGIKNVAEVEALKRWSNFRLIAVDAPVERRYGWYLDANRLTEPDLSPAAFAEFDRRDRGVGEPPWGQQVDACMRLADRTYTRDGAVSELYQKLDAYLDELRGMLL